MEWDTAAAQAVLTAAGGQVFEYDENLPVSAYVGSGKSDVGCGMWDVGSGKSDVESSKPPPTSYIPPPTSYIPSPTNEERCAPRPLRYNKENLLNPSFVASGLIG
jgi:hypothetical protein